MGCADCKYLGSGVISSHDGLYGITTPQCEKDGMFISTGGLFSSNTFANGCSMYKQKDCTCKKCKKKINKPSMRNY